MKGSMRRIALALSLLALTAGAARAEVKTRDRSQVKFEGMLGRIVGVFGGKAAKEGIVSTTAVKGDRKATMNETTGRIVDLSEEKVYELDVRKKTYTVLTFEQLRQQMREAREKAEREAEKNKDKEAAPQDAGTQVEVDFDVKETGQTRSIAGFDTHETVMTITVREKGRTLDDAGGLVLTTSLWLGPDIPEMKELAQFELKYWNAIAPEPMGVSPQTMAQVMAMYPLVKQASERLAKEQTKLQGTPLATTSTFEVVKSKEAMQSESESSSGSGGGVSGMLARKMMKKSEPTQRATFMTVMNETLELSKSVAESDLAIPAGFKQAK